MKRTYLSVAIFVLCSNVITAEAVHITTVTTEADLRADPEINVINQRGISVGTNGSINASDIDVNIKSTNSASSAYEAIKVENGDLILGKTIVEKEFTAPLFSPFMMGAAVYTFGNDKAASTTYGDGSNFTIKNSPGNTTILRGVVVSNSENEPWRTNVTLGKDTTVSIVNGGVGSMGIQASFGSTINVGENVNISVKADKGYGVVTKGDAVVNFLNGGRIAAEWYSLYAESSGTKVSKIEGDGQFTIHGNMKSIDKSLINMTFQKGSLFVGGTAVAENVANNMGKINFDMKEQTLWRMTEASELTTLQMTSGANMTFDTAPSTFSVLTVQDLKGNSGTFNMRTDLIGDGAGNNTGDLLKVTGTSAGDHLVHVTNQGASNATGNERLTIIETSDGQANFDLINEVEVGGYKYDLHRVDSNQKNWELYSTGISNPSQGGMNTFAAGYLLNYAELDTLMKRMGDLRNNENAVGMWIRGFGGKFEAGSSRVASGYDLDYSGLQIGIDRQINFDDDNGRLYVGGMLGQSRGKPEFHYGRGTIKATMLGLYGTYFAENNFYADLVGKYSWRKSNYGVRDSANNWVDSNKLRHNSKSISLELGRRLFWDNETNEGTYLEPQGQLSYSKDSGGTFKLSNGLRVKANSYDSLIGRVGVHLGYELKQTENPINVYGKVSYLHEFDGDMSYRLNGSPQKMSYGDSWWTYGLGITTQLETRHSLYLDIERSTGGEFKQPWAINGGYRYSF